MSMWKRKAILTALALAGVYLYARRRVRWKRWANTVTAIIRDTAPGHEGGVGA